MRRTKLLKIYHTRGYFLFKSVNFPFSLKGVKKIYCYKNYSYLIVCKDGKQWFTVDYKGKPEIIENPKALIYTTYDTRTYCCIIEDFTQILYCTEIL